jgi:ribosomal protein S18 acetylase RimI-like enzyme
MSLAYRIRSFQYPADYSAVLDLWEHAGPGVHVGRSDTPAEIEKKLQRDPELFLVAVHVGQLVGTVLGGFDGRRGIVYHLAVREDHRRQGLGVALMNALEERLKALGCLRYYLLVTPDNHEAMHFYDNYGCRRLDLYAYGKDIA